MMKKPLASSIVPLLLFSMPLSGAAEGVCDQLKIGKPPSHVFPVVSPTLDPPDISKLFIQVYSTKPVSDTGDGLVEKCRIAQDLFEVDRMMKDVGFGGYATPEAMPLFTNAYLKNVSDNDRETVRNVVREILNPAGVAEDAIGALTVNADLYDETVLNVYYVDAGDTQADFDYVSTLTGMHIRDVEGNSAQMIFISDSAKSDTVAHEFAHAFSAGHVNFWDFEGEEYCIKFLPHPGTDTPDVNMECEFPTSNYMWAASVDDRAKLVEGQKERMMRNEHSVIFKFSPSSRKLNCPDFSADPHEDTPEDDACPRMGPP